MTFFCTHLHLCRHFINKAGIRICQLMLQSAYKSQRWDLACESSTLSSSVSCIRRAAPGKSTMTSLLLPPTPGRIASLSWKEQQRQLLSPSYYLGLLTSRYFKMKQPFCRLNPVSYAFATHP